MAVNLTETAIRALKAKKTSFYVWSNSSQRGTGRLGVKVQSSGSKIFYFRYYVEKGKKERFIQLGIWPEMKLATANELAKKYGAWLIEGKDPQANWNDNSLQNSNGYNSINHRAHLKH